MPSRRREPNAAGARTARRGADRRARALDPDRKPTRRERLFKRVMQVTPVRRLYARRLMRFLDKSKKKGRDIPDQLAELDDYLSKIPAKQRRSVLEATLSGELDARAGREVRRAASRQGRQKGRAAGGQRPGMPPIPGARPKPQ